MKQLSRILVVGLGNIAIRHRSNMKILCPGAEIIAASASGRDVGEIPEHADSVVADVTTLDLNTIDFAIIASPASYHLKHARLLKTFQIPCLVEKPLTSDLQDAEAFLQEFDSYPAPIAVGYCLRFTPSAAKVREIVQSGLIGDINTVYAEVGQYLPDWRNNKDYKSSVSAQASLGGGALLELSHEIDYLSWIFGELKLEFGRLGNSTLLNLEVEEIANICLSGKLASTIFLHLDFLQRKSQRYCKIIGESGRIDWDLLENKVTFLDANNRTREFNFEAWERNNMYLDMVRNMFDKTPRYATPKEAAKVVRLIDEIKKNSLKGLYS